jgi:methylenetetrahydrofolate dehydrogenase (NADP+)/methenyltetrahydrofolate cyclohydrolase
MAEIWKGAAVAAAIQEDLLKRAAALRAKGITPTLAVVRLGARPDDLAYERGVLKRFEGIGVRARVCAFAEDFSQNALTEEIEKLNADGDVHGILIFRPLPKQIDEKALQSVIAPEKDVDCLNPLNAAGVFAGDESAFAPCTPEAVMDLLAQYGVDLTGKRAVVVGRSMVVGKPLAMLLLKRNATVTVCHTRTKNLAETCKNAEILIAAAGAAKMLGADCFSPGQIVIDVGINVDGAGNLCGDADFEAAAPIVAAITPVPGGVGTVTTSVLAKHVVLAAERSL